MKKVCIVIAVMFFSTILYNSLAMAGEAHGGNGYVVQLPQNPAKNPRLNQVNPLPQQWGIFLPSITQISAFQFVPYDSSTIVSVSTTDNMRYRTAGGYFLRSSLNLPSGVKIEGIEIYGCDDNPATDLSGDIYAWVVACTSGVCTWYGDVLTQGQPGCDYFYYDLSTADLTVDNYVTNYFIEVRLSANDDSNRFQNFNVYYSRQVSPAPQTATFNDVPTTHPFFRFIEALNASGITAGCGGGNFCPDAPLTRGQMAVFLSTALGLYWPF